MTLTHPSPNFGDRRDGAGVRLVVLHYTVLDCGPALDRLRDPAAEVSCHYLIDRDGTVLSLVDEAHRAWHAGAGSWGGTGDVNSRSIGVELVNGGNEPFPQPQMLALERLLTGLLARHALPPQAVIGHSDMAPDRKSDPGPRFDWRALAARGLSVWPQLPRGGPHPPAPSPTRGKGGAGPAGGIAVLGGELAALAADLQAFGYPAVAPDVLLAAFRRRFRPWARGPFDPTDRALAAGLRRFAVDGAGGQA